MKPKHYLIIAIIFLVVYLIAKLSSGTHTLTTPQFYPDFTDSALVNHAHFSLIYNENHEQADWVTYSIKPSNLESRFQRRNIFREDTLIESGTATNKDYSRSGFDRGHLVPAGDMTFDSIALEESFYYSNISPQLAGFNRGVWKRLENHVRTLSSTSDSVIIFTGPVFTGDVDAIGENSVSVPDYFYKIIIQFSGSSISTSSYLLPHEQDLKGYEGYRVSIDSIEYVTGLDFMAGLPDRLEDNLERNSPF